MKLLYRPEIDGLRAIAVLAVILYHAQITVLGHQPFQGGFIGVDIFFVISGYLITSIIYKELIASSSFSFKYFYERRIRRILPIYLFIGFVTILLCYLILPHKLFNFNFSSFVSSLFFVSNYFFYNEALQYSALGNTDIFLLHTWSLSVEEQFYLIFPILFLFIFKKFNYKYFFISLFIFGLIVSIYFSLTKPNFSFYSLPTRFFELLLGSLVCFYEKDIKERFNQYSKLFCFVGFFLIIFSILLFSHETLHPSHLTLIPLFGTILIIIFSNNNDYLIKIISSKVIVFIGLISYSLYLWHYPIFLTVKYFNLVEGLLYKKLLLMVFIFVISYLSYRFIEKPFRRSYSFKTVLMFIFSLIILSMTVGYLSKYHKNFLYQSSIFLPQDENNSIYWDDEIWHMLKDEDGKECFDRNDDFCVFNSNAQNNILLVGNSVMAAYAYNIKENLEKNYKFTTSTAGGCMYIDNYYKWFHDKEAINVCDLSFQKNVKNIINKSQPGFVIYGGNTPFTENIYNKMLKKNSKKFNKKLLIENIKKTIYSTLNNNIVILVYPYPYSPYANINKDLHLMYLKKNFSKSYKEDILKLNESSYIKQFREIRNLFDSIEHPNLYKIKPIKILCNEKNCSSIKDNKFIFSNNSHPSFYGSEIIVKEILAIIENHDLSKKKQLNK